MTAKVQFYTIALAVFLTAVLFFSFSGGEKKRGAIKTSISADAPPIAQIVESIPMKGHYSFAGEDLPMDNFDVRERLERELTVNAYWQSSTLLNLKRTTRYFPLFDQIFAEEGIPDDCKYIAMAESDLKNGKSPAGASGLWQFMKGSAQEYGLEVNSEVDERYHPEKATRAACQHLKKLKNHFGSWTMAAAAYNRGETGLKKEAETQRSNDYYNLNLNTETSRYIFRIVAFKELVNHPLQFGYQIDKEDYYQPLDKYSIVTVDKGISNLGDFAKKYNTTYRMLKVYNPWLRSDKLTNKKGKKYYIKVPK